MDIKKIAYNCKQATFLIEKKQITPLTIRERIELKIHLGGCSVCQIFKKQSMLINKMVKQFINPTHFIHPKLDDQFKESLQKMIKKQMGND